MTDLIARLQAAGEGSRELDAEIALAIGWREGHVGQERCWYDPNDRMRALPERFTTSLDAALTLLPEGASNHQLVSYIGHGNDKWGKHAWAFSFSDTTRTKGIRIAKAETERRARAAKSIGLGEEASELLRAHEKAVSEQWLEFCARGATPALAIIGAALRALKAQEDRHDEG